MGGLIYIGAPHRDAALECPDVYLLYCYITNITIIKYIYRVWLILIKILNFSIGHFYKNCSYSPLLITGLQSKFYFYREASAADESRDDEGALADMIEGTQRAHAENLPMGRAEGGPWQAEA